MGVTVGRNRLLVNGITLADALKVLISLAKQPVALIIDEAQHALTTNAVQAALKALKSPRDTINIADKVDLMLVMTASDRDKLLRLVNSLSAAFYVSTVQKLPTLDVALIDDVAKQIESSRPETMPVVRKILGKAFPLYGEKSQFL
jgi:chlorite dismutase